MPGGGPQTPLGGPQDRPWEMMGQGPELPAQAPQGQMPGSMPAGIPMSGGIEDLEGNPTGGGAGIPMPEGVDSIQALLGVPGQDPLTGGATNVQGLLDELSGSRGGRSQLIGETTGSSAAFQGAPSHVRNYLTSRLHDLSNQYATQDILNPTQRSGDFLNYLSDDPSVMGGKDWDAVLPYLQNLASSPPAPGDDIMGQSAESVQYAALKENALNIMRQALGANTSPSMSRNAEQELMRRYTAWSSSQQGAPSNQAEFFRQQAPLWEGLSGNR